MPATLTKGLQLLVFLITKITQVYHVPRRLRCPATDVAICGTKGFNFGFVILIPINNAECDTEFIFYVIK